MNGRLINIEAGKLLEKFGKGSHKPGSGSASALIGMLSAQLMLTVIDLTDDPKRRKSYAKNLPKLLAIRDEVRSRIYPELESLFQEDSEQFDKVINLRELRDKESNPLNKRLLSEKAQEHLKICTELPIKIAELICELSEFAADVFDYGFQSARGDSGAALNSAISGVASCLSIIELNLISLPADKWMTTIRQRKALIKSHYERLCSVSAERLRVLEKAAEENFAFQQNISAFRQGNLADTISSYSEIEAIVTRLQNMLWLQRDKIWKRNIPEKAIEVLKPDVVLSKVMGYTFLVLDTLGVHTADDTQFEIAGLIDKNKKLVQVSKSFPKETQNFTAAHELAHAVLHKQIVLHRDRPIDGSVTTRSLEEMQADKFASYFLMPTKAIVITFQQRFVTQKFVIDESTALALGAKNVWNLRDQCENMRGLARLLASVDYYDGKRFNSLAKTFGVSVETMAIRLEELSLLDF